MKPIIFHVGGLDSKMACFAETVPDDTFRYLGGSSITLVLSISLGGFNTEGIASMNAWTSSSKVLILGGGISLSTTCLTMRFLAGFANDLNPVAKVKIAVTNVKMMNDECMVPIKVELLN